MDFAKNHNARNLCKYKLHSDLNIKCLKCCFQQIFLFSQFVQFSTQRPEASILIILHFMPAHSVTYTNGLSENGTIIQMKFSGAQPSLHRLCILIVDYVSL